MPRTSVLLPTRDSWPTLREAVESTMVEVAADGDAELVVIDDGSTDESRAWLDEWCAESAGVRLVRTTGIGLPGALNAGLAATDSEYVARMDADDVWVTGRLPQQLTALTEDPQLSAVGTQIIRFVGDLELGASALPTGHDDIVTALLHGHHGICHPSVTMRRRHVDEIRGYWAEGVAEDFDLFLRLSDVGRLANLPTVGLKYRMHAGGINAGRQLEVQKRMAYSAATYRSPRGELTFEEFDRRLARQRLRHTDLRRRALGLSLYRQGLVGRYEQPRSVGPAVRLLASTAVMPERVVQRGLRRLRQGGSAVPPQLPTAGRPVAGGPAGGALPSPGAFSVHGIPVFGGDMDQAVARISDHARRHAPLRVHLVNSYSVALSTRDTNFREALRFGDLNLPDGAPVAWIGRLRLPGYRGGALRGPEVMARCLQEGLSWGASHWFIGGSPESQGALVAALEDAYPGVKIAGISTPWARDVADAPMQEAAAEAAAARPDYVWVGLGTPKQDHFMVRYGPSIDAPVLGVGAAFDFAAGTVAKAPAWTHGTGTEWLFRLASEPRRLLRRYAHAARVVIPSLLAAAAWRALRAVGRR